LSSYEIIAVASKLLFEEYADVMLLKTCPIKRHDVPGISEETNAKTFEQLEEESKVIVDRLPKPYFNFRHQYPLNAEGNWNFKPDKWLEEKEMGAYGYFHPTKNLKNRGAKGLAKLEELNKAWETSNMEAMLNDPEAKKTHKEICEAIQQKTRPTARVISKRGPGNLDSPTGKRARINPVTPSPFHL
jgi:hypothetical protein